MASYSKTVIVGNLTRDVEVQYLPSGQAVATVTVASSEKYKNKAGEQVEDTLFLDCKLWGKTAELAGQYLAKGRPVLFDGRLKQENWEDKQSGQKRSKIVLNVDTMQFLGSPGGAQDAPAERKPATQHRQSKPIQRDFDDSDDNAEVPF